MCQGDKTVQPVICLKMHMAMYFLFTQVQAIKPLIIHMMRGEKYEPKMNQFLLKIIHYVYYGQYYDYESDMTYLRARYYDSSIKRFITEDPAKDGSNWYAYCGNNPVMMFDPSGLAIYVPENQSIIIDYLNILTRDELYIDSNGYVKIME